MNKLGPRQKYSAPPWFGRAQVQLNVLRVRLLGTIARLQELHIDDGKRIVALYEYFAELVLLKCPADFLRAFIYAVCGTVRRTDLKLRWLKQFRAGILWISKIVDQERSRSISEFSAELSGSDSNSDSSFGSPSPEAM